MHTHTGVKAQFSRDMISVEQALAYLLVRARSATSTVVIPIEQSLGRVLAESHRSPTDVPAFDNSAMDGIAINSDDIADNTQIELQVSQRIAAGGSGATLQRGHAARIFTGAPLPRGADSVVMQEDCLFNGHTVKISGPVSAGQHVRPRGNNVAAGEEVLAVGVRLRPQEMGIAATVGLKTVPVFASLKVAIFSSGDELREPGEPLEYGEIYNSNRYTLLGLLSALGCAITDLGIVKDDLDATVEVLEAAAADNDVIISSGGVSVGEEDHVKSAVEKVGSLEMWRVAVKPGKPLAYGRIGNADFIGLPGNPVSTLVTFCLFVRPFILRRQGVIDVSPSRLPVIADFAWPKPMRRREYVRARLRRGDADTSRVQLYDKQGSDVMASTVWADGLVEIPEHHTVAPGDVVDYLAFSDLLF